MTLRSVLGLLLWWIRAAGRLSEFCRHPTCTSQLRAEVALAFLADTRPLRSLFPVEVGFSALLCPSLVTRLWKRPQAWCQRAVQCVQAARPDGEGVRMRCEPGLRSDTVGCEFSVKEATAPVQ